MNKKKAVVLLSGGLDSTTCLYYAIREGFEIIALSFNYQQRHSIEIEFAKKIVSLNKNSISKHIIFPIDLSILGGSSLTSLSISVPKNQIDTSKIPNTYVPSRNIIFLSIASAVCEVELANHILIGANQLDYSGYPDCRHDFIKSYENVLQIGNKFGLEKGIHIHTPLIQYSKKEIIEFAHSLKVPFEYTWSCYDPKYRFHWNKIKRFRPCGSCDSCLFRQKGFELAGFTSHKKHYVS